MTRENATVQSSHSIYHTSHLVGSFPRETFDLINNQIKKLDKVALLVTDRPQNISTSLKNPHFNIFKLHYERWIGTKPLFLLKYWVLGGNSPSKHCSQLRIKIKLYMSCHLGLCQRPRRITKANDPCGEVSLSTPCPYLEAPSTGLSLVRRWRSSTALRHLVGKTHSGVSETRIPWWAPTVIHSVARENNNRLPHTSLVAVPPPDLAWRMPSQTM